MKKELWMLALLIVLICCKKENAAPVDNNQKYFPKVKAIIQGNCTITCHSPSKGFYQGLPTILDNDSDIVKSASAIKRAITGPFNFITKKMPLGGHLSVSDSTTIVNWVDKGGTAND